MLISVAGFMLARSTQALADERMRLFVSSFSELNESDRFR
jgi:hypothetical protein